MQTEIEVKFLRVNHNRVRSSLKAAGATMELPMRLMRRQLLDHTDGRYRRGHLAERLRVRDEGDKVTITYKKSQEESQYVHELETTVGSYDEITKILIALGFESFSYQESKRETWHIDETEVVLDEWPWLEPYIEIEGPSEHAIKQVAEKLGFAWSEGRFGSVDTAYRDQYPKMTEQESIGEVPIVRFADPVPQWLIDRL